LEIAVHAELIALWLANVAYWHSSTYLPWTCATARPQLAKADTAFQAHPLVNRLNLA
jgi:hypothetical protein